MRLHLPTSNAYPIVILRFRNLNLLGPGEVECLFAIVSVDMAVEKGAVASTAELVAGWSVVEAGNDVPELPDTLGAGFDQTGTAPNLIEPTLDHRIVAGDHEGIVQP